jgi:thiamine pyrophosphate-dependent acetolactate synthase large subunit-like protein
MADSTFAATAATLKRADVLRDIDAAFPVSPVVLTLGGTAREMIAVAGRRPNHLVNLDAMGQTIAIALGLAVGLDRKVHTPTAADKVVVVEGDGSLLMGLTVMSTTGHLKPHNLVVLALDNDVYLATGGQPTAARDMDFCAVALASGWAQAREVHSAAELAEALSWAGNVTGPVLVRIRITTDQIPTDFFLEDPAILAEDFRRWLRSRKADEPNLASA